MKKVAKPAKKAAKPVKKAAPAKKVAAKPAKVEVKNMNSFRGVRDALEFEIARQTCARVENPVYLGFL